MTSAFTLQQIDKAKGAWTYVLPGSPLGIEDSYLKITGQCHPQFTAIPIGNKYGAKLCVRNVDPGMAANDCGITRIGDHLHEKGKFEIEKAQGYRRGSVNLYDPLQRFPTQEWNPDFYSSRRTPWQGQLTLADYLQHTNVNYNGTGIKPIRTPHELQDKNTKYLEYAYAFTPLEDPNTGKRIATSFNQNVLTSKYDVSRLVQPYQLAMTESEYLGIPYGNTRDTKHYERIV